jgi:hypothetical protein
MLRLREQAHTRWQRLMRNLPFPLKLLLLARCLLLLRNPFLSPNPSLHLRRQPTTHSLLPFRPPVPPSRIRRHPRSLITMRNDEESLRPYSPCFEIHEDRKCGVLALEASGTLGKVNSGMVNSGMVVTVCCFVYVWWDMVGGLCLLV